MNPCPIEKPYSCRINKLKIRFNVGIKMNVLVIILAVTYNILLVIKDAITISWRGITYF